MRPSGFLPGGDLRAGAAAIGLKKTPISRDAGRPDKARSPQPVPTEGRGAGRAVRLLDAVKRLAITSQPELAGFRDPCVLTAMDDSGNGNNECGICLGEWTNPVKLPCGHSFCADCLSGWKPKHAYGPAEEGQRKRCPLCRGVVPPSQEQVASYKITKSLMKDTSDPDYEERARVVKQFEAEYGEDWDGTMIEYDNEFVDLPKYVCIALGKGNLRAVLQWLGKGNIRERVNAKCEELGNAGLLYVAAMNKRHDLMSYLLLNGADVNILDDGGASVLTAFCINKTNPSEAVRLLLSWGAENIHKGERVTEEMKLALRREIAAKGHVEISNLVASELGGRRCEIVSAPKTRDDLVGKTCVAEEYIEISDHYKVRMDFTNESLLLSSDHLKRRDRTPQDPGYYVECKNNRLIRRDFKSNEECRAFIVSLREDVEESSEVDPDAEAKAEQAAADLLSELGLDDLEGPSCSASKKIQHAALGKKKKRGGKKKGRKGVGFSVQERHSRSWKTHETKAACRRLLTPSPAAAPPCQSRVGRPSDGTEASVAGSSWPPTPPNVPAEVARSRPQLHWPHKPYNSRNPSCDCRRSPAEDSPPAHDDGVRSPPPPPPSGGHSCRTTRRRPPRRPAMASPGRTRLASSASSPGPGGGEAEERRAAEETARIRRRIDAAETADEKDGAPSPVRLLDAVKRLAITPKPELPELAGFRDPCVLTAMDDSGNGNNECGICLGEWTNPVKLPCGHSFCADCLSGWKPKHAYGPAEGEQRKRCPLCRGAIPPSQEQIAEMKLYKSLMQDTSDPDYEVYAAEF
ncbi:hypothetical protein THAOC_07191 [Thalassiosira oceanica]|uniref:RING-type domain-containing protein n=1 Tax=Thalassiosira oceanica TaxID=159749 RepID=K0T2I7_THAOC|nr:hypothetical protein THAOC_07191 [Thalassiosira oceanica]|eukprot:EJK71379.1 hypothetical protein THAOC_07191 [Thalassiosira oceanica]